jgi:Na+-driven multidrug efflux pump
MQPTQAPAAPGIWASIREALHGSHHHDYTQLSLDRAILLLAIPMVLEMSMESLFAIVDAFSSPVSGLTRWLLLPSPSPSMVTLYAVAIGLSTATTAMVARRIGEHDPEGASFGSRGLELFETGGCIAEAV